MRGSFNNNHHLYFKECVEKLGAKVLLDTESNNVFALFEKMVPIKYGKIDWKKIDQKKYLGLDRNYFIAELKYLLGGNSVDKNAYLIWDSYTPVLKTDLDTIVESFDALVPVSLNKFIFNPYAGYAIEISKKFTYDPSVGHWIAGKSGDEITIGLVKPYDQIVDVIDAKFIRSTKAFLKEVTNSSILEVSQKIPLAEEKINEILLKIKQCDKDYEVVTYFELLEKFKDFFKKVHYKEKMSLPDSLQKFIKTFNRIDLSSLREKIFNELKKSDSAL